MIANKNFNAYKDLVSVVMATYNGQKFIREQVESILNQSYRNIELVVMDDCSNDDTLHILNGYAQKDNRICIYPTVKNLGLVKNFERGLRLVKGQFIVLSDQDDIFCQDKVAVQLEVLRNFSNCDLVVSDLGIVDEFGDTMADSMWSYQRMKPRENKPFHWLVMNNFATGCAMMFHRRLLDIALPFPSSLPLHDHWLAIVAASERGGGIRLIDKPLTKYRQHSHNVIGAQQVKLFSISHYSIKPCHLSTKAENNIKFEQLRLNSYLLRRDIWSADEEKILSDLNSGYLTLLPVSATKLSQKLTWLPCLFSHSFYSRNPLRNMLRLVFLMLSSNSSKE